MLRYLQETKSRWNCRLVLNCYPHFDGFKDFFAAFSYVDVLVRHHEKCDYHTNLYSLPSILAGDQPEYPLDFVKLLQRPIPEQPSLQVEPLWTANSSRHLIGLVWQSHPNVLALKKSIALADMRCLQDSRYVLYSLVPEIRGVDFLVEKWPETPTAQYTASLIACLDAVVSVDTFVLHLAGAMGKPTFGLLALNADPRWGSEEKTPWYPSVRLFRQKVKKQWSEPLRCIKEELALLS